MRNRIVGVRFEIEFAVGSWGCGDVGGERGDGGG